VTDGERRERHGGRRLADAELQRARKRLIWAYATMGAMFATGALMMAVSYLR
jgi:hypothetical protein